MLFVFLFYKIFLFYVLIIVYFINNFFINVYIRGGKFIGSRELILVYVFRDRRVL